MNKGLWENIKVFLGTFLITFAIKVLIIKKTTLEFEDLYILVVVMFLLKMTFIFVVPWFKRRSNKN